MTMLRRHFEAVITAHAMDRSRKELYVEGQRDRLFLSWLIDGTRDPNVSIHEIETLELPGEVSGGNRGRLIRLVELLENAEVRICAFADADWDRLFGRRLPRRLWLTDH